MSTTRTKPVKLQINDSGSWRNVIRFDAADDQVAAQVMEAAATLGHASERTTFRIAIDDCLSTTLMRWSREKGWKKA